MTDAATGPPAGLKNGGADPAWGDPPRSAARSGAPVLSAAGFEGPLDWLLELARAQKIDLARLSIAALIGSFADALEAALARPSGQVLPLASWGEWLEYAAMLARRAPLAQALPRTSCGAR